MVFFEKSQPAPECLAIEKTKASGNYNCGDVLNRLQADFCNKCYLCEQKGPTSINTEHFIPHRGDVDLKFDWNNLFFACGYCNNTKGDRYEDILNCTIEAHNVDSDLKYELTFSADRLESYVVISAATEQNSILDTTIDLLMVIYNGLQTANKQISAGNLRNILEKELAEFNDLLDIYIEASDAESQSDATQAIVDELHKSSPFTAFKRWIIKNNEVLNELFGSYCL